MAERPIAFSRIGIGRERDLLLAAVHRAEELAHEEADYLAGKIAEILGKALSAGKAG